MSSVCASSGSEVTSVCAYQLCVNWQRCMCLKSVYLSSICQVCVRVKCVCVSGPCQVCVSDKCVSSVNCV